MKLLRRIFSFVLFFICSALCMTGSVNVGAYAETVAMMDNYTVYGATAEADTAFTYAEESSSLKMQLTSDKAGIYLEFPALQDYAIGDEVVVDLRLYMEGTGYNGTFKLYKAGGELIDYAFPGGVWSRVRFQTRVFEKDGVKNVLISMEKGKGLTIWLSNPAVDAAEEDTPLFGGVKLYQIEPKSNLMNSYIVENKEGEIIVMDGGDLADADNLIKVLRSFTNEVDHWFISHYHCDHLRALVTILEYHNIKIKNLYFDVPTSAEIKQNCGDGDGYLADELVAKVAQYPDKVENVITPKRGMTVQVGEDVTVKVLNDAYKVKNNNYGNNTTVVYKVETPGEDILFLGDLGDRGDAYLEDEWFVAEAESCTVIQLAHHGQNGTTDKFYNMIKEKKVVLYAAKQWIYDNDNGSGFNTATLTTLHMRDLVREWGVLRVYTQAGGRLLLQ